MKLIPAKSCEKKITCFTSKNVIFQNYVLIASKYLLKLLFYVSISLNSINIILIGNNRVRRLLRHNVVHSVVGGYSSTTLVTNLLGARRATSWSWPARPWPTSPHPLTPAHRTPPSYTMHCYVPPLCQAYQSKQRSYQDNILE